jgi:hypothetical protein
MRLITLCRTASSPWIGAAAMLLLAASPATLSASQEKEKESRSAPARENRSKAAESTPARSTPSHAPAQRESRSPATTAPARQSPSPSYTPAQRESRSSESTSPNRQTTSPSYTPSTRQQRSTDSDTRSNQTTAPSYAPQTTRPSTTYAPSNSGTQGAQSGGSRPTSTGGWRQVESSGQTGSPERGNRTNQAGSANGRNSQFGGGGNVNLPPGQTTRNSDGSATHRASDGRVIQMDRGGRVTTVQVQGGGQVHYASNGQPDRVVTRSGAVINNRPGGMRQIVVERPGRVVMVTNPRGQGYIQRPFAVHGHEYYQRTYYAGGRPYVHVYRPYYYHGAYYPYYMPMRYYRPAYYGWVYAPWGSPVIYNWGWGGSPWYGYYGPYFTPYPVYRSPLFWLTDFFFAETMQAAYEQRMADNAAAMREANYESQEAMRPEIKQMVADEVQRQLAEERAESQNSGGVLQDAPRDTLPGIFNDGASHALLVHMPLRVDDGAQGCTLTEGDVIGFNGNLTPGVEYANVRVLSSRGGGCAAGRTVSVSLQDILEMQNHLRETIDRGLGELQSRAGRGGMPAPPAQAMGGTIPSPLASAVPAADANAASELSQQAREATQGEQEVLKEAPALESGGNDAQQPPTVSLGMTPSEVQSMLGPPRRVVDLGQKKMFIYDDMKVIFMDGRVSDVQ